MKPRPSAVTNTASSPWWHGLVACLWLSLFLAWFFSLGMPNNVPLTRADVWRALPGQAIELTAGVFDVDFDGRGWAYLPQRLGLWGVGLWILAAAWGLGRGLVSLVFAPRDTTPVLTANERNYFALLVGLSALSLAVLAGGLAGCLSPWVWRVATGLCVVVGVMDWQRSPTCLQSIAQPNPPDRVAGLAAGLAVLPFVCAIIFGSCSPETDFDVKEYHFGGPKEWSLAGRMQFLDHNVYTSFPFLTEMLILLGMQVYGDWYWGALAGKVVLAAFAGLTGYGLYLGGVRAGNPRTGLLAAVLWLSTPWTVRMSLVAYTEGGVAAYVWATWLVLALASRCDGGGGVRLGLLAGAMAGSAMACKYPGLFLAVVPAGLWLLWSTQRGPHWWRAITCYAAGVAFAVGPWLLKNVCETGNPVYPLGYRVFGGWAWSTAMDEKFARAHASTDYSLAALMRNLCDVLGNNDWHSPLLFALAPLVVLAPGARRWGGGLWLALLWLFGVWWCLTHRLDRFWTPMIAPACLAAALGLQWSHARWWKVVSGGVLLAGLLFNGVIATSGLVGYNAWLTDLNRAARQSAEITSPEIVAIEQMQQTGQVSPTARVLCVGEAEPFDARFEYLYNTVFDDCLLEQWCCPAGGTAGDLRPKIDIQKQLTDHAVTHVLVNWQEILRYRVSYGYTDYAHPATLRALVREGVLSTPLPFPALGPDRWPVGFAVWEQLDPQVQQHVTQWAPELKRRVKGVEVLVTVELFPVQQQPAEEN